MNLKKKPVTLQKNENFDFQSKRIFNFEETIKFTCNPQTPSTIFLIPNFNYEVDSLNFTLRDSITIFINSENDPNIKKVSLLQAQNVLEKRITVLEHQIRSKREKHAKKPRVSSIFKKSKKKQEIIERRERILKLFQKGSKKKILYHI